jgi:hypothetical protein
MSSTHLQTLETRAKISAALKGKPKSLESRAKMRAAHVGIKQSPESNAKRAATERGRPQSQALKEALARAHIGSHHSEATRAKLAVAGKKRVGLLAGGWKGGICPEGALIRASMNYDAWRVAVFTRDEFVCQKCGDNKGGNLEAHHMDCFADFPEKRMDMTNGVTLCDDCHNELHRRYGCLHNRKWQTDEFLAEGV